MRPRIVVILLVIPTAAARDRPNRTARGGRRRRGLESADSRRPAPRRRDRGWRLPMNDARPSVSLDPAADIHDAERIPRRRINQSDRRGGRAATGPQERPGRRRTQVNVDVLAHRRPDRDRPGERQPLRSTPGSNRSGRPPCRRPNRRSWRPVIGPTVDCPGRRTPFPLSRRGHEPWPRNGPRPEVRHAERDAGRDAVDLKTRRRRWEASRMRTTSCPSRRRRTRFRPSRCAAGRRSASASAPAPSKLPGRARLRKLIPVSVASVEIT